MREIEQVVAELFPHSGPPRHRHTTSGAVEIPSCIEGRCRCGASGKRARMLAAIQMHVDEKTRGRIYLDRS